jgi:hypothetical protein
MHIPTYAFKLWLQVCHVDLKNLDFLLEGGGVLHHLISFLYNAGEGSNTHCTEESGYSACVETYHDPAFRGPLNTSFMECVHIMARKNQFQRHNKIDRVHLCLTRL